MPSFQRNDMEIDFDANVDTELLEASVEGVNRSAKLLSKNFESLNQPIKDLVTDLKPANAEIDGSVKGAGLFRRGMELVKRPIENIRTVVEDVNKVVAISVNSISLMRTLLEGTLSVAQRGAEVLRSRQGLSNLGADPAVIERVNRAMGETVDKLTIAKGLQSAAFAGLSSKEMEDLGKAAAYLANQLGKSKAEMFGVLQNGELTDDQLKVIGLSAQKIEDKLGDAADKQQMALTQSEARGVRLRTILEATRRASDGFTKSTKDAGDEGDKILATFTNLKNELARNLLPLANSMLQAINNWIKRINLGMGLLGSGADKVIQSQSIKNFGKLAKEGFEGVSGELSRTTPRAVALKNAMDELGNRMTALTKVSGLQGGSLIQKMFGGQVDLATAQKVATLIGQMQGYKSLLGGTKEDAGVIANIKTLGKEIDTLLAPKSSKVAMTKRLGVSDAVREAKEELRGFRSEARSLLRNFDASFTTLVSNIGGSFSGVVSALNEIPEKFRILGSLPHLREGISKTIGLTAQQIDQQKTHLKLSNDQVKAAKLFAVALQAGRLDAEEYIGNEKAVNAQLRAGISLLSSQAKISSVLVELNNLRKDVTASSLTVELLRTNLLAKEADIRRKLGLAIEQLNRGRVQTLLTELAVTQDQLKTLGDAKSRYDAIGKERKKILETQRQMAVLERQTEIQQKHLDFHKQRVDAYRRIKDLVVEITEKGNVRTEIDVINDAAARRIKDAKLDIAGLNIQIAEIQGKITQGLITDKTELKIAQDQLRTLKATLDARREEIELTKTLRDVQLKSLSVTNRVYAQFAEQVRKFNADLASNIVAITHESVGGVGSIITGFFNNLVSGQENALASAGKAFLQVLAGMAGKLAAFYITAGTAQLFIPPYTGAGAIAAGLGLAALAGVLGGAASLIDTGAGSTAAAAATSARTPSIQTSLPGLERPESREPKREYYLINGLPFLNESNLARSFVGWIEREGRKSKGRSVRLI